MNHNKPHVNGRKNIVFLLLWISVIPLPFLTGCNVIEAKKELVFLIDEGMRGTELTGKYSNDTTSLKLALDNIYDGLKQFQSEYDVSVLIYPTWSYSADGFPGRGDVQEGMNRIHTSLHQTIQYFGEKGIGTYLELYSSGIYTNQNGELGNLPLVNRYYGKDEPVKSLSVDLDCLEALFRNYKELKGVRFHELIGSNDRRDDGHGFAADFELPVQTAQLCQKYNKRLIWSDHSWDLAFNETSYSTPDDYKIWLTTLNKVCDILADKITIVFANNGWGGEYQSLTYGRTMAGYRNNNRWGYSVQSWWWQEIDARALPRWGAECGGGHRWYSTAMIDMPIELMAAFSIKAFQLGADLVQLEPAYYFFHSNVPKQTLTRYADYLLNAGKSPEDYPSMDPVDYYTTDIPWLLDNSWVDKPPKYNQTTLVMPGSKTVSYDTYNSNPSVWYQSHSRQYPQDVFSGNIIDAVRIDFLFNQIDEILVVKKEGGKLVTNFYNSEGVLMASDSEIAATNNNGEFAGICALNLWQHYEGCRTDAYGDTDEIVVARKKNGNIHFTVYTKESGLSYKENGELTANINLRFPAVSEEQFICMLGLRKESVLFEDNTKSQDCLLIALKDKAGVLLQGDKTKKLLPIEHHSILDIKCADVDMDWQDEVILLTKHSGLIWYKLNTEKPVFNAISGVNIHSVGNNRMLLPLRWSTYFKKREG